MEFFSDPVLLARLQFASTAMFHFLFVPLTVGIGLIMAINETRYYKTRDPKDAAATKLWVKIFAATFVVGVATGITMEFSFGTNWADYSRFVGDIFGAPLAAEALLAFFLESVFLGILIFGRNKVSPRFYMVSAWLTWFGSCLSALWILIANSWMQTPAGSELAADGSRVVITNFLEAAFNPSLLSRYSHTVLALLVMGAFVAIAIAAWYMHKKRHPEFAIRTMKIGAVVGVITCSLLLISAHSSAVVVAEEQPTKFAMMEGMYESEVAPLYVFGWVDEESQEVIAPFSIPGGTSFLATGAWDTEYEGLNQLAETEKYGAINVDELSVNLVFQSYHLMVLMFGAIALVLILALLFAFRKGKITNMKWLQKLLIISPIFPVLAIQAGWMTAEYGRQPWVVYPSSTGPEGVYLLTQEGASQVVSAPEILITLTLFALVYTFILIAFFRVIFSLVKKGPLPEAGTDEVEGDTDHPKIAQSAGRKAKVSVAQEVAREMNVGKAQSVKEGE